jgi:hypothetical protein
LGSVQGGQSLHGELHTCLPFLEVAAAGSADALVTGNLKHFKPARGRHGVSILPPAELLRLI